MVSEAFVVCLCAGIRVAGLWLAPMEAITIQITTSVIKETLEEDSSEFILPQSRQANEEKGFRQTLSSMPHFLFLARRFRQ